MPQPLTIQNEALYTACGSSRVPRQKRAANSVNVRIARCLTCYALEAQNYAGV